ncbi:MAG: DinB family protein [Nocardioides sp.]|nr:DinB family protein [Nocardioides sp.]
MLNPAPMTETEALAAYIDEQAGAIFAAAHGLTEEQARRAPCRSTLSVGGLLKHATFVMRGPDRDHDHLTDADFKTFIESFALGVGESLEVARQAFRKARSDLRVSVLASDPDAAIDVPSAPWHGRFGTRAATARFQLLHLVEELARHAGHADIIREQVDGAGAGPLMLAEEDLPGNDFMAPWTAEAATATDGDVSAPR